MTGHAVRGRMGFVAKEGATFDYRLNVRLHSDEVEAANQRKKPEESLADYMRAALRFYILHGDGVSPLFTAEEREAVGLLAAESRMTPSEWAREAVREKVAAIRDEGINGWGET